MKLAAPRPSGLDPDRFSIKRTCAGRTELETRVDGWKISTREGIVQGERSSEALGRLYCADEFAELATWLADMLRELGEERPRSDEIRLVRIDPAIDLRLPEPSDGLRLLGTLQSCRMPRLHLLTDRDPTGRPVGVWWKRRSRGIVARAYDHGRQHRYADVGTVVRLEVQDQWSWSEAPMADWLARRGATDWLRDRWSRRFGGTRLQLSPRDESDELGEKSEPFAARNVNIISRHDS